MAVAVEELVGDCVGVLERRCAGVGVPVDDGVPEGVAESNVPVGVAGTGGVVVGRGVVGVAEAVTLGVGRGPGWGFGVGLEVGSGVGEGAPVWDAVGDSAPSVGPAVVVVRVAGGVDVAETRKVGVMPG